MDSTYFSSMVIGKARIRILPSFFCVEMRLILATHSEASSAGKSNPLLLLLRFWWPIKRHSPCWCPPPNEAGLNSSSTHTCKTHSPFFLPLSLAELAILLLIGLFFFFRFFVLPSALFYNLIINQMYNRCRYSKHRSNTLTNTDAQAGSLSLLQRQQQKQLMTVVVLLLWLLLLPPCCTRAGNRAFFRDFVNESLLALDQIMHYSIEHRWLSHTKVCVVHHLFGPETARTAP